MKVAPVMYLHVSIYFWIRNNFGFFLPSADLGHNFFKRKEHLRSLLSNSLKMKSEFTYLIAYLLYYRFPDSELKNQVFPLRSFLGYANHIGLYKPTFSEVQTHQVYSHCTRYLQIPVVAEYISHVVDKSY